MNSTFNINDIRDQAEAELVEETFRAAVDACKVKLKAKRWWHKLLPFKVVIIKREEL
jgi:hypothetical protein